MIRITIILLAIAANSAASAQPLEPKPVKPLIMQYPKDKMPFVVPAPSWRFMPLPTDRFIPVLPKPRSRPIIA